MNIRIERGGARFFRLALATALVFSICAPYRARAAQALALAAKAAAGGYAADAAPAAIHTIQGAGHVSPLAGALVRTAGVVTAVGLAGFYLQDPAPDGDDATAEGIFIRTEDVSALPPVRAGDQVQVTGTVAERRQAAGDLSTTEIRPTAILVGGPAATLPAPVVLGSGGRIPPGVTIEDPLAGDVESGGVFDPAGHGLDFYESLEGMRVQVNRAQVIGPTSPTGEIPLLGDGGEHATTRSGRGGLVVQPGDQNPERILIDDELLKALAPPQAMPAARVGDRLAGAVTGVMDYTGGHFTLEVEQAPLVLPGALAPEAAPAAGRNQLAIAALNGEGLYPPGSGLEKVRALAGQIVNALGAPDLLLLEGIQGENDGVNARLIYLQLIAAVLEAGGPEYDYRQLNPSYQEDGAHNPRLAFLFRADRGLAMQDRQGAGPKIPNQVLTGPDGLAFLQYSPGRVDPLNAAFAGACKSLAAEFRYHDQRLIVIGNQFVSRAGDSPWFGRWQPPRLPSQETRLAQAQAVADFVRQILALDPAANVVLLGDFNDDSFSPALGRLTGAPQLLFNLTETLPVAERYSHVAAGNSEALDHILLSPALFGRAWVYDLVHLNAEYADVPGARDPPVLVLNLNRAPILAQRIPDQRAAVGLPFVYPVPAGTFHDPDADPLRLAASLENGGALPAWLAFDPASQTFSGRPGAKDYGSLTLRVTGTDSSGAQAAVAFRLVVVTRDFLPFLSR